MKKIQNYSDEYIGEIKIIEDFLPKPEDLVLKNENVKVTISLSRDSIEFFKEEAKKHHTKYQKLIRNLLDIYAKSHKKELAKI